MNRGSAPAMRRLAAMLVVLVALFHVQWLAACEFMPPVGAAQGCCAKGDADHAAHCGERTQGHDCVTPFAKGASGVKLPERVTAADTDTPESLVAAPALQVSLAGLAAGPPPWPESRLQPDGRSLYLASSRLRL